MARSDIILDLVRAGTKGDNGLFIKALEALIAEERAKQHHVLADRLATYLSSNGQYPQQLQLPKKNGSYPDLFFEIQPNRRLEDIILADGVRTACLELIEEHHRSDLLRSHDLEPRHRILLAGPPGNGKTSLAEALASELAVPLIVVRYESVIASYLGETAVRLSRLFEQVRTRQCVLFFDEFDVVGKERGDIHETGEIKRVVSSLLLQVDSLPSYVVVVTATNHPELLDRAVWRRFQLRLELGPPTAPQIVEWFQQFERSLNIKLGLKGPKLAQVLGGLSYSELEQFSMDVRRRYVLGLPESDTRKIFSERLEQWGKRYTLTKKRPK